MGPTSIVADFDCSGFLLLSHDFSASSTQQRRHNRNELLFGIYDESWGAGEVWALRITGLSASFRPLQIKTNPAETLTCKCTL
jgi:hypothetical protein